MRYPMVEGYCNLAGGSLNDLAKVLDITRRTLTNKISGKTDFTLEEALIVANYCGRSLDSIFLSQSVPFKLHD